MIIYDKIVVSTTEPKEKIVLWYDPSKQDMFWYNDGWTSLTIIPAYRSIEEDIKKLFSMIDVSLDIDSIIEEKIKKWIGEITVNFDNIKINLESKQDKLDKGLTTTSKNIVGAINEVLNVAQSGGGINPPQPAPSIEVDTELNKDSSNPIANKAVASQFYTLEQDLKGDIEAKANQSEVDSIDTRIGTLETNITSKVEQSTVELLQTAVGNKAESSEVSALSDRVDSMETELDGKVSRDTFNETIGSLNGDIAGKSDKIAKQEVEGDQTISPNTMYVWGSVAGALTITKGDAIAGIVNNYMIRLTAGEGCAVTFSGFELDWFGGEEPSWTAGNTYEISIVDNIALWAEIEPTQA